mmetsp:Transcript_12530/g.14924  ORF Transcript_12530/g.14924 Transcript_12530/m.14924 type:complete len:101 (-) Transcript_12530:87-389(-)
MRSKLLTLGSLFAGASHAVDMAGEESQVIKLNVDKFYGHVIDPDSRIVLGSKPWFIKLTNPGCPHCAATAPEWNKFEREFHDSYNIAVVNCASETDRELC